MAHRQNMYFAGLLSVASAFLFTAESALAQKLLPSTLAKTVKVENFTLPDTAPITLLSVSPVEIKIPRYGPPRLPEMTFTFYAERPVRSISATAVRIQGGVAAPTYESPDRAIGPGGRHICNSGDAIGGISYPPKPEPDPPARYQPGLHHCTWPLTPLLDAIYNNTYNPSTDANKLQAGDRIGFIVIIFGAGTTPQGNEHTAMIVTVPVKSADTGVRRSP